VVFDVGSACSESITALRLAGLLLAAQPELARALVVIGEQRRARILGYDRETYQPVFSDAGAALMVEREARLPILGFGYGTDGRFWDFIANVRREEATRAAQAPVPAIGTATALDPRRPRC
jgi:3-oxoacyl-[acyl-carrier-protein] synthase III